MRKASFSTAAIVTQYCNCGMTYFKVDYDIFDHKRHCTTCISCYEHITIDEFGKITSYPKEQQCICYEIKNWNGAQSCCAKWLGNADNWNCYDNGQYFAICPNCNQVWSIDTNISNATKKFTMFNSSQPVTRDNWLLHYTSACNRLKIYLPLGMDLIKELFSELTEHEEFEIILNLLKFENYNFNMTNKTKTPKEDLELLKLKLKIRLELFKRVPSGNNMILAFALIEEITLKKYQELDLDSNAKLIDKFDKCKNLALGTKHIPERKVAFDRAFEMFKKFANVEI